jgi:hypothetical protein
MVKRSALKDALVRGPSVVLCTVTTGLVRPLLRAAVSGGGDSRVSWVLSHSDP